MPPGDSTEALVSLYRLLAAAKWQQAIPSLNIISTEKKRPGTNYVLLRYVDT